MAQVTFKKSEGIPPAMQQFVDNDNLKAYEYKCSCGAKITLHTDTKPYHLEKCFKCNKEIKYLKGIYDNQMSKM